MRIRMLIGSLCVVTATSSSCGRDDSPAGPATESESPRDSNPVPGDPAVSPAERRAARSAVADALIRVLPELPPDGDVRRLQSALGYLGELIDEGSAAALADAAGDANALAADLRFRHTGDPDALLHLDVITLAIERAASLGLAADRGASPIAKPSTTTSR